MTGKIIKIIVLSLVVVLLIALLVIGLTTGFNIDFRFFRINSFSGRIAYDDSDKYSVGGTEIPLSQVSNIEVHWPIGSVSIKSGSGNNIAISEKSNKELTENERLRYYLNGSTLIIQYSAPDEGVVLFKVRPEKTLELMLPASGNLENLTVNSTSASINIGSVSANNMSLHTVSGSVEASGITCSGNLELKSTSGSVSANDTTSDISVIKSTSGSVNVSGKIKDLFMKSTSGTVKAEAQTDKAELKSTSGSVSFTGSAVSSAFVASTSGSVKLTSSVCPASLEAGSTSGDIVISVPQSEGFTAQYSLTSGNFNCEFPVVNTKGTAVYGDGSAQFKLSSTSGDISILKIK